MHGEQQGQAEQHSHRDHNGPEDTAPPGPASTPENDALGIVRVINAIVGVVGVSLRLVIRLESGRSERHRSQDVENSVVYVMADEGVKYMRSTIPKNISE